ncbi:hypothetical protein [Vibrio coralliilyticus]|uniref:hypothetical protein n=1 Tax=Vibrio coralliilyticus TaxID=190893 RepID=UPI001E58DB38|nr:hypothetical protein [Vibrio coralliilyticus]MCC2521813.1 hypothetical protein [Vibrio coralliilyticus]
MNCRLIFALAATISSSGLAQPSFNWDWTISVSQSQHRDSVWFEPHTASHTEQLGALLRVQAEWQSWSGLFAAQSSQLASSNSSDSADNELIVQELFWQGVWETGVLPLDMTLGKIRLDWGVGYGYRPLDLFKPYRRNPVGIQVEEGAGVAMASYFDLSGEWSLLYSDSSWTKQESSELEQRTEQQGIGLRRYWLTDETEWQAIAYYDDVRQGLIGGSMVSVYDASWAYHASFVYQRDYLGFEQQGLFSPVILANKSSGFQGLVGLNWASQAGNQIIVEYWYDNRAWSKEDWRQGLERATALSESANTTGLSHSYAQGLNHINLVHNNVMFHWSLNPTSWSQWQWSKNALWLESVEPTFDLLLSPQDGGVIATQWINYSAYDSGQTSVDVELAARFMTGSHDSVYANLSDKRMIFINLKGKF